MRENISIIKKGIAIFLIKLLYMSKRGIPNIKTPIVSEIKIKDV